MSHPIPQGFCLDQLYSKNTFFILNSKKAKPKPEMQSTSSNLHVLFFFPVLSNNVFSQIGGLSGFPSTSPDYCFSVYYDIINYFLLFSQVKIRRKEVNPFLENIIHYIEKRKRIQSVAPAHSLEWVIMRGSQVSE